ncbi:HEAT repeat domain-containing protein [Chromobacterium haemolyticum]|uniref:HEAT repeat domain-containing protein n=1 Tax=Chromobacterium haemolyticum TaxID=394935 RepID=UPI001131C51A|nr:HEAT repeat domain-containing protein [Chromobacterium haemolyticum]
MFSRDQISQKLISLTNLAKDNFNLLQPHFLDLYRSTPHSGLLNTQLTYILNNPEYENSEWDTEGWTLFKNKILTLKYFHYTRTSKALYSYPFNIFLGIIGSNSLPYKKYNLPASMKHDQFNPKLQLDLNNVEHCVLAPGEVLYVNAQRYLYDFQPSHQCIAFKLYSPFTCLQWMFDRTNGHAIQAIAASQASSELMSIASAMTEMPTSETIFTLHELAKHHDFFIRWHALQQIAKLSRETAIQLLKKFSHDPHPQICIMAQSFLSTIEQSQQRQQHGL